MKNVGVETTMILVEKDGGDVPVPRGWERVPVAPHVGTPRVGAFFTHAIALASAAKMGLQCATGSVDNSTVIRTASMAVMGSL